MPGQTMFKHSIQSNKKFTHTGYQSYFPSFSCSTESVVELTDNRIKPACNQRVKNDSSANNEGANGNDEEAKEESKPKPKAGAKAPNQKEIKPDANVSEDNAIKIKRVKTSMIRSVTIVPKTAAPETESFFPTI